MNIKSIKPDSRQDNDTSRKMSIYGYGGGTPGGKNLITEKARKNFEAMALLGIHEREETEG